MWPSACRYPKPSLRLCFPGQWLLVSLHRTATKRMLSSGVQLFASQAGTTYTHDCSQDGTDTVTCAGFPTSSPQPIPSQSKQQLVHCGRAELCSPFSRASRCRQADVLPFPLACARCVWLRTRQAPRHVLTINRLQAQGQAIGSINANAKAEAKEIVPSGQAAAATPRTPGRCAPPVSHTILTVRTACA